MFLTSFCSTVIKPFFKQLHATVQSRKSFSPCSKLVSYYLLLCYQENLKDYSLFSLPYMSFQLILLNARKCSKYKGLKAISFETEHANLRFFITYIQPIKQHFLILRRFFAYFFALIHVNTLHNKFSHYHS